METDSNSAESHAVPRRRDEDSTSTRGRVRDDRIEIRCFAAEKELLRRAAELDHRTLSNWLLAVALREARRMVESRSGSHAVPP